MDAMWNCIFYTVKTYQDLVLKDMGFLLAFAYEDQASGIYCEDIEKHLRNAVRRVNVRLLDQRNKNTTVKYNGKVMSYIIGVQNLVILDELKNKLGMDLSKLDPMVDLKLELKKRSDFAFMKTHDKILNAR